MAPLVPCPCCKDKEDAEDRGGGGGGWADIEEDGDIITSIELPPPEPVVDEEVALDEDEEAMVGTPTA